MKKKILIITLLLLLTSTIKAWAPAIGGGGIGAPISLTNVPQVSGKTVTFNNVYFGNWPLIIRSDGGTSNTPLDNYIIKFDVATKSFGFEADAGGAGNAVYIEEDDVAEKNSSAADLYINFTGDFDVTDGGGNQVNVALAPGAGSSDTLDSVSDRSPVTNQILSATGFYARDAVTSTSVTGNSVSGRTVNFGRAYIEGSLGCAGIVTGQVVSGTDVIASKNMRLPFTSGDVTLDAAGKIHFNTLDEQISVHSDADGEISGEVSISLIRHLSATFDPAGWYDQESTYRVLPLMVVGDDAPEGITITEWRVTYVGGDPTTELDADLMYDTTPDYNPAAGATVMDVLDTTAGSSSADTGFDSATASNGSYVYIRFGADPTDANVVIAFDLWFYNEED